MPPQRRRQEAQIWVEQLAWCVANLVKIDAKVLTSIPVGQPCLYICPAVI